MPEQTEQATAPKPIDYSAKLTGEFVLDSPATPANRRDLSALRADAQRIRQDGARAFGYPVPGLSAHASQTPAVRAAAEQNERLIRDEFRADQAPAKQPAVRIVHRGGPARLARVYLDGHEADNATRVEIVLDASQRPGTHARIEFAGRAPIESANVQLDVAADAADIAEDIPAPFFWPVLLGLLLNAIPVGLAWWTWTLHGPLPEVVFTLCVIASVVWTLGVLGAFVGYGRVTAASEPDESDDCECDQ